MENMPKANPEQTPVDYGNLDNNVPAVETNTAKEASVEDENTEDQTLESQGMHNDYGNMPLPEVEHGTSNGTETGLNQELEGQADVFLKGQDPTIEQKAPLPGEQAKEQTESGNTA